MSAASGESPVKEGEAVTLAVRSENIRIEEERGLEAEIVEKSFAGGLLRVVLKLSDGTEVIASRYGIDAGVQPGQRLHMSFQPEDAVLVDRQDKTSGEEEHASARIQLCLDDPSPVYLYYCICGGTADLHGGLKFFPVGGDFWRGVGFYSG